MTRAQQSAIAALMRVLPESTTQALLGMMAEGPIDSEEAARALGEVDWREHRELVADLLDAFLPIEELVPDYYANWRPVVHDSFLFIARHLSPQRLIPKLIEQVSLPPTASTEERILAFSRRLPSLQKIGQTIARNRELTLEFRIRLANLEDGIREVSEAEIRAEIERQLGDILLEQDVKIAPGLYAEGSVSAIVRFSRRFPPPGEPASGVFKVLKPFIPEYFREDLDILAGLARYLDEHQDRYHLGRLNLGSIVEGIRDLFLRETDFVHERQAMAAAGERYRDVPDIRIPVPIYSLSTATITAMTEERSVKVTAAFPKDRVRCREVAYSLAMNLAARPLFWRDDLSIFHADPHAGNLRISDMTGDIVVLDWALTDSLTRDERRSLVLLSLAVALRDEGGIREVLASLSLSRGPQQRELIAREVEKFIDGLPAGATPGVGDLLERLLRAGAEFDSSFLIYRKMLATLGDVVEELAPGLSVESVIVEFAIKNGLADQKQRDRGFAIPLGARDLLAIGFSLQSFLPRVCGQGLRNLARKGSGA
jgi:ubiquinone biosynthesis protein